MTEVTICSDFGAQEKKVCQFLLFPHLFAMKSILKDINPEKSLEALMLKLKLQYFGHLMRRVDSLEKTLILGKD